MLEIISLESHQQKKLSPCGQALDVVNLSGFTNQEGADYVFNSLLPYELCVMKKHALPILTKIPNDSPYYIKANRLIKFLKYFVDIDDEVVPNNSLMREFIGGSCFEA